MLACLSKVTPLPVLRVALVLLVLSVAFYLHLSGCLLLAVLRSISALLSYSASYLHVLAAIVFPLSLCTQPPCFRGGRSAEDATPFRLVCVEEDSGTFGFFICSSGVSSIFRDSHLHLLSFCS